MLDYRACLCADCLAMNSASLLLPQSPSLFLSRPHTHTHTYSNRESDFAIIIEQWLFTFCLISPLFCIVLAQLSFLLLIFFCSKFFFWFFLDRLKPLSFDQKAFRRCFYYFINTCWPTIICAMPQEILLTIIIMDFMTDCAKGFATFLPFQSQLYSYVRAQFLCPWHDWHSGGLLMLSQV